MERNWERLRKRVRDNSRRSIGITENVKVKLLVLKKQKRQNNSHDGTKKQTSDGCWLKAFISKQIIPVNLHIFDRK